MPLLVERPTSTYNTALCVQGEVDFVSHGVVREVALCLCQGRVSYEHVQSTLGNDCTIVSRQSILTSTLTFRCIIHTFLQTRYLCCRE